MTAQTVSKPLSVASLSVACIGSCASGALVAWITANVWNWADAQRSAALGVVPTLIGATIALTAVRILIGSGQSVAIAAVAAGVLRTMVALFVALAVFFMAEPEGRSFWTAFLISNLLALIAESIWGIKNNAREALTAPQTAGVRE